MIKKWSEYIIRESKIERLDETEEDIYNYALKLIDDRINDIFIDVHQEFDTVSGEITPGQSGELDDIQKRLAKLIAKQVSQNLGEDFSKVKSSDIDIETLKNLSDERKDLKEGDDVILVYFDGGYSIYRCKLSKYVGKLGYIDRFRIPSREFYLDDAYMAVSVDTYNDFCDPSKRLN